MATTRKPTVQKNTITVTFELNYETKNKVRYDEPEGRNGKVVIGTIYVPKEAAEKLGNPEKIQLAVSAA